jgi:hypothetical protein
MHRTAWSRDLADREVESEMLEVNNEKTGKKETREHVWIQAGGPRKEKVEKSSTSRVVEKGSKSNRPTQEVLAAAEKRAAGFVKFEADSDFFKSSSFLKDFGSDEAIIYLPNGKHKKKIVKKKGGKDKLVDMTVVRTQGATKVMTQVRFVNGILEDAARKAAAFFDIESPVVDLSRL